MNPETSYLTNKQFCVEQQYPQAETYGLSNIKATHTRDSEWEARDATSNQSCREIEAITMELTRTEFGQYMRVHPQKHHGIFQDHKWSEPCFYTSFKDKTAWLWALKISVCDQVVEQHLISHQHQSLFLLGMPHPRMHPIRIIKNHTALYL